MTACLDSWAVLAWLDGEEPAASGWAGPDSALPASGRVAHTVAPANGGAPSVLLSLVDPPLLAVTLEPRTATPEAGAVARRGGGRMRRW